jgi:hypothetical protein
MKMMVIRIEKTNKEFIGVSNQRCNSLEKYGTKERRVEDLANAIFHARNQATAAIKQTKLTGCRMINITTAKNENS